MPNNSPLAPNGLPISILARPNAKGVTKTAELIAIQEVLKSIVLKPTFQVDNRGEVLPVPAREIASCARVWCELEDLRMAKKGFGRPKPVEAKNQAKRKAKIASTWEEPSTPPVVLPDPPHKSASQTP